MRLAWKTLWLLPTSWSCVRSSSRWHPTRRLLSHSELQTALCCEVNIPPKFLGIFGLRQLAFNPKNPHIRESFNHVRAGRFRWLSFSWVLSVRVLEEPSCQRKEQTHMSRVRICLFTLSLLSDLFLLLLVFYFPLLLFTFCVDQFIFCHVKLCSSCVLVVMIRTFCRECESVLMLWRAVV